MVLVNCPHCDFEHDDATERCPMTGALMPRPEARPEPDDHVVHGPNSTDDSEGPTRVEAPRPATGGTDPFAEPRVRDARPEALALKVEGLVPIPLDEGATVLLGRDAASPIAPVCEKNVGRRHAELRVEPAGAVLTDLDSKNGTFLNGDRLLPARPVGVHDQDVIRLGANPPVTIRVIAGGNR